MKAVVAASLLGLAAAGGAGYDTYPAAASTTPCETSSYPAASTYPAANTYPASSTYPAANTYPASYPASSYPASYPETTPCESSTYAAATYPASSSEECSYTTEVVTAYTTYCPEATVISHGTWTYSVTAPGTVTVTNCPCTITHPVYSTQPAASAPYPTGNATAPTGYSTAPAPATSSYVAQGAASTLTASGAALAGIVALVAFLF